MSLRMWVVSGVLALLAGTLLRLSRELGIPALRMVGFWSLVAIGLLAAREMGRQQVAEARARLRDALGALGAEFEVVEAAPGLTAVVAPGGVLALAVEDIAQYARGPLARRRLAGAEERARRAAGRIAALAEDVLGAGREVRVVPVLVLLRRRAPGPATVDGGVAVVNPEALAGLAGALRAPVELDRQAREALAGALAAGVVGADAGK